MNVTEEDLEVVQAAYDRGDADLSTLGDWGAAFASGGEAPGSLDAFRTETVESTYSEYSNYSEAVEAYEDGDLSLGGLSHVASETGNGDSAIPSTDDPDPEPTSTTDDPEPDPDPEPTDSGSGWQSTGRLVLPSGSSGSSGGSEWLVVAAALGIGLGVVLRGRS